MPVAAGATMTFPASSIGCAAPAVMCTVLAAGSVAEALDACHEAVANGVGALVAVGGDGTVNLALQAVAGTDVAFGMIPAGTGNDFAHEIGLPRGPRRRPPIVIADALRHDRRQLVDLARMVPVDGPPRWFGAVLGAGFDADRQRAREPDAVSQGSTPLRRRHPRRADAVASRVRTR